MRLRCSPPSPGPPSPGCPSPGCPSPGCPSPGCPPPRCRLPLLRHTDVPPRVTEKYILSGYRSPDYTLRECLQSAFRATNETGNFWTHFLPLFVFCQQLVEVTGWAGAPPALAPFFYPLWTYALGVCGLLLASSLAHLLNSMSLVVREVCFFVDYGTISCYTVGSSLAYFYYIHPRPALAPHPDPGVFFEWFYVPAACAVALICVLSCCNTRQRWRRHRYVIRTLVFLLPFLVSSTPVFYRLLAGSPYPAGSPAEDAAAAAPALFLRHCLWLVVSGVLNVSKIPERVFPGHFDVWGHSHQWFHCCTFMSILDQLHMLKAEVRALILLSHGSPPPGPTAASTFGVMLALQASVASVIARFSWSAHRIYGPRCANKHPD